MFIMEGRCPACGVFHAFIQILSRKRHKTDRRAPAFTYITLY